MERFEKLGPLVILRFRRFFEKMPFYSREGSEVKELNRMEGDKRSWFLGVGTSPGVSHCYAATRDRILMPLATLRLPAGTSVELVLDNGGEPGFTCVGFIGIGLFDHALGIAAEDGAQGRKLIS
jgi:hypothetical protein